MKTKLLILSLLCSLSSFAQNMYDSSKLSRFLVRKIQEDKKRVFIKGSNNSKSQKICVLLKAHRPEDIHDIEREYDLHVIDRIGDIFFTSISTEIISNLSKDKRILRIDAHEMPMGTTDEIPQRIRADKVQEGFQLPQAYTGSGVIAGIIDLGFDFTHPMFYDQEGNCRIVQFFDMQETESDNYGKAYSTTDILSLQHSPLTSSYHGTHVASIMAGSTVYGERNSYVGISPECDIALAEIPNQTTWSYDGQKVTISGDLKNSADGTTANCILAMKRIFDYADTQGKPCVINFSAGYPLPITDPCILENEAISALLTPGHILVAGAGNDAEWPTNIIKRAEDKEIRAEYNDDADGWYGTYQRFTTVLEHYLVTDHPQNLSFYTLHDTISFSTDTLDCLSGEMFYSEILVNNGNPDGGVFYVMAYKKTNPPSYVKGNIYELFLGINNSMWPSIADALYWSFMTISIESDYPCELYTNPKFSKFDSRSKRFLTSEHTISWPASHPEVIAVGSLRKKIYSWDNSPLSSFSSQGPNWYNDIKPDVVAIGESVHAAYNKYCDNTNNSVYDTVVDTNGNENYIKTDTGTSMAGPVVAGCIALWLQAKPDLTSSEVREILSATCSHPEMDIDYPNNQFGYGEVDAYKGLLNILKLSDNISNLSQHQPRKVSFCINNNKLIVISTDDGSPITDIITLKLFTTEGRIIAQSSTNIIDLVDIPEGVYIVQLYTKEFGTTGSSIIRIK